MPDFLQSDNFRARLAARALEDEDFRRELLANPRAVVERECGLLLGADVKLPEDLRIEVHQESSARDAFGDSGGSATGGTGSRSVGVLGADSAAGAMSAGGASAVRRCLARVGEPRELLSQICGGPLLAAFTIFRDGDARRLLASGDEIYRDFCGLLRRGGLAAFFVEFPELGGWSQLCNRDWREAHAGISSSRGCGFRRRKGCEPRAFAFRPARGADCHGCHLRIGAEAGV